MTTVASAKNKIVEDQAGKKERKERKNVQLYNVATFYQLMNAIHLKMQLFPKEKADIILMDATDFSHQASVLRTLNIFENVYDGVNSWKTDREFASGTEEQRKKTFKTFLSNDCGEFTKKAYTDYFMGAQTPYFKMVYYALCEHHIYPKVHLFGDGIYTYVLDFVQDCERDGFWHGRYGSHDIRKNLGNIYGYGTEEMYLGSKALNYTQVPPINSSPELWSKETEIFTLLWGECPLPKEKYIFLEEGMFQDHALVADITLLDRIAKIVGKENIIIKRHPRCVYDRFSTRGYKVLEHSSFPWEVSLMNEEASKHVLLSLSSTATTTGKTVLGKNIKAIQLYKIRPFGLAGPHCSQKKFPVYAETLYRFMNQGEKVLFVPRSNAELTEIIKYIEGEA